MPYDYAMAPRRRKLNAEAAARRDLATLPDQYRRSAVAETYLMLCRRIDAGVSARDAASLTREIRMCLLTLFELAPAQQTSDPLDEVRARREKRLTDLPAPDAHDRQPG
jgi:hypothetical protein